MYKSFEGCVNVAVEDGIAVIVGVAIVGIAVNIRSGATVGNSFATK